MRKTKSITFDKEAQDNLPKSVKEKMRKDRVQATQSNFCPICKKTIKITTGTICEHQDCVRYR